MRKTIFAIAVIASQIFAPNAAKADPADLVSNGSFEANGGLGQINGTISYATDWSRTVLNNPDSEGFAFIMNNTADSVGAPSIFTPDSGQNVKIWGPANGSNNGFTGSPDGGYFMVLDGAYGRSSISQTISGLTLGLQYELSFQWAAGQLTDSAGDFWAQLDVSFGPDSASTGQTFVASQGFSPWLTFTNIFTASSTSQTLTFTPSGPSGLQPVVLLDGVSLNAVPVPEPSTYLLGGMATVILALLSWKKQNRKARRLAA